MNYTDYTDDVAMFMFTHGQILRVEACLAGPRQGLMTAAGRAPATSAPAGNEA